MMPDRLLGRGRIMLTSRSEHRCHLLSVGAPLSGLLWRRVGCPRRPDNVKHATRNVGENNGSAPVSGPELPHQGATGDRSACRVLRAQSMGSKLMAVTPPLQPHEDRFDVVVRDFIDFVNLQVGAYMDAMAGFAGHHARVDRQVHRICRANGIKPDGTIVHTSYEDPAQPDFILSRIERADNYLAANARGGGNEQQLARSTVIFLYTYWEDSVRPRLAVARQCAVNEIKSDLMGDLREMRHAVLHSKGLLREKHSKLKVLGDMFTPDEPIRIPYDGMHRIFVAIKQEFARLLLQWQGISGVDPATLRDIALQHLPRGAGNEPTAARPPS